MQVFVSYSHADRALCDWFMRGVQSSGKRVTALRQQIEQRAGSLTFWRDVDALRGGDVWRETIQTALAACDIFLVFVPREANRNVAEEVAMAVRLQKKILPVVWEGYYDRKHGMLFGGEFRNMEEQLGPYHLQHIQALRLRDTSVLPILTLLLEP